MDLFTPSGATAQITGSICGIGNALATGLANAGARPVPNEHILFVGGAIMARA